jgi:hypothetical protein
MRSLTAELAPGNCLAFGVTIVGQGKIAHRAERCVEPDISQA